MRLFSASTVLTACVAVFLSCGGQAPPEDVSSTIPVDTLVPVDSIGIMMGESCYMFGTVFDFSPLPMGGAAILDMLTGKVSIFDEAGEYEFSFGGRGEGPGEFQYPVRFARLGSGLMLVAEMLRAPVSVFTETGEFIDRWDMGNIGNFELDLLPFDDSPFVSYNFAMVQEPEALPVKSQDWNLIICTISEPMPQTAPVQPTAMN